MNQLKIKKFLHFDEILHILNDLKYLSIILTKLLLFYSYCKMLLILIFEVNIFLVNYLQVITLIPIIILL